MQKEKAKHSSASQKADKSQAAVQYLAVYGFAILMIFVAFSLLIYYVVLPNSLTATTCNFPSGSIYCNYVYLSSNLTTNKAYLTLFLTNTQDYPIRNPNVYLNVKGINTSASYCFPAVVISGGSMICTITLPFMRVGSLLVSNNGLYLEAQYCGLNVSYLKNKAGCSSGQAQIYVGSFSAHTWPYITSTPIISITPMQSTESSSGQPDTLISTVSFAGIPLKGATVLLTENTITYNLRPSSSTTNIQGQAYGYISGYVQGSVLITANYSGYLANTIVQFSAPQSSTTIAPPSCEVPPKILYYAPINITNNQASNTPSSFQQMISFDPAAYSQYEDSNLQNVEFFYCSNATIIHSWLEGNATNEANAKNIYLSTNGIYWLMLPKGIAAQKSLNIAMGFVSKSTNLYDGKIVGTAPQLNCTSNCPETSYGQYDNGASVFTGFYDNFKGKTINASKWQANGASYSVNNGLTYNYNPSYNLLTSLTSASSPYILDYYGSTSSGTLPYTGVYFDVQSKSSNSNSNLWAQSAVGVGDSIYTYISGTYDRYNSWGGSLDGNYHVYTLEEASNNDPITVQTGYVTEQTDSTFPSTYTSGYFGPRQAYSGGSKYEYWTWIRIRSYPPNGIMPSVKIYSIMNG